MAHSDQELSTLSGSQKRKLLFKMQKNIILIESIREHFNI